MRNLLKKTPSYKKKNYTSHDNMATTNLKDFEIITKFQEKTMRSNNLYVESKES